MPAFNEIRHYELDAGVCVAHLNRSGSRITVAAGALWLTREGEAADYWLRAGDSLVIAPKQRIWLSAEADTARFHIKRELQAMLSVAAKIRQTGGRVPDRADTVLGMITSSR